MAVPTREQMISILTDVVDDWDLEALIDYAKRRREAFLETMDDELLLNFFKEEIGDPADMDDAELRSYITHEPDG
jgi:hypothetical protein